MADQGPNPTPMIVEYTNHEGRTELRRILPTAAPFFGTVEPWHPNPCWLLPARDLDRGVDRIFALAGMYPVHRSGIERMALIGTLDSLIADLTNAAVMAVESLRNAHNHYRADKLEHAVRRARKTVSQIGPEILAEARRRIAAPGPDAEVKFLRGDEVVSQGSAGDLASSSPGITIAEPETLEERAEAMEPAVAEFIVRAAGVVCSEAAFPGSSLEEKRLRRSWLKILAQHAMDEESVRHAAETLRSEDLRRLNAGEDV